MGYRFILAVCWGALEVKRNILFYSLGGEGGFLFWLGRTFGRVVDGIQVHFGRDKEEGFFGFTTDLSC